MVIRKLKDDIPFSHGLVAAIFYLLFSIFQILHHQSYNLLSAFYLGCWLVGVGLLVKMELAFFVGMFWLILGVPFRILDLLTSRDFIFIPTLTHIGGLIITIIGLKYMKTRKLSWAYATGGLITLVIFSRLVTPAVGNVNFTYNVPKELESPFPSHLLFSIIFIILSAITFFISELAVRFLESKREFRGIGK